VLIRQNCLCLRSQECCNTLHYITVH